MDHLATHLTPHDSQTAHANERQSDIVCPQCDKSRSHWTDRSGYANKGKIFCCQGCAEGTGCTCVKITVSSTTEASPERKSSLQERRLFHKVRPKNEERRWAVRSGFVKIYE